MKKLFALVFVVLMVMCLGTAVFAEDGVLEWSDKEERTGIPAGSHQLPNPTTILIVKDGLGTRVWVPDISKVDVAKIIEQACIADTSLNPADTENFKVVSGFNEPYYLRDNKKSFKVDSDWVLHLYTDDTEATFSHILWGYIPGGGDLETEISFHKYIGEFGNLAGTGFEFDVYAINTPNVIIDTFESNADGVVVLKFDSALEAGQYGVREHVYTDYAPVKPLTFTVDENGDAAWDPDVQPFVINKYKTVIEIQKYVDTTDNPGVGFTFNVYPAAGPFGVPLATFTSDTDGVASYTFDDALPEGTYIVRELRDEFYKLAPDLTFTVDATGNATFEDNENSITNITRKTIIEIKKYVDSTDNPGEGFVFDVYPKNGPFDEPLATFTTDASGYGTYTFQKPALAAGDYIIRERVDLSLYAPVADLIFTVDENDNVTYSGGNNTIINLRLGKLTVTKDVKGYETQIFGNGSVTNAGVKTGQGTWFECRPMTKGTDVSDILITGAKRAHYGTYTAIFNDDGSLTVTLAPLFGLSYKDFHIGVKNSSSDFKAPGKTYTTAGKNGSTLTYTISAAEMAKVGKDFYLGIHLAYENEIAYFTSTKYDTTEFTFNLYKGTNIDTTTATPVKTFVMKKGDTKTFDKLVPGQYTLIEDEYAGDPAAPFLSQTFEFTVLPNGEWKINVLNNNLPADLQEQE